MDSEGDEPRRNQTPWARGTFLVIELTIGHNGQLAAGQQLMSPAIYLDHWALRAASEDTVLGARLTQALEARGGTLLLSWANIVEFLGLDARVGRSAEEFLETQLPRLFFLEADPFKVVKREKVLMAGGRPSAPHADVDLLRVVVGLRPSGVQPITCMGMLAAVARARPRSQARLKAVFVDRVSHLRTRYLDDRAFRMLVDRAPRGQAAPHATAVILREVVAGLMRDRSAPLTANDGLDFFHTIVPVAYADFVLLDGRWRDQVDRLRARLIRTGIDLPLATAFSGAGAMAKLIDALEGDLP